MFTSDSKYIALNVIFNTYTKNRSIGLCILLRGKSCPEQTKVCVSIYTCKVTDIQAIRLAK